MTTIIQKYGLESIQRDDLSDRWIKSKMRTFLVSCRLGLRYRDKCSRFAYIGRNECWRSNKLPYNGASFACNTVVLLYIAVLALWLVFYWRMIMIRITTTKPFLNGRCAATLYDWGIRDDPFCACGGKQTIIIIIKFISQHNKVKLNHNNRKR